MYMNYDEILMDANIRKKQQLYVIKHKCCPNCANGGKDCLKLEHTLQDGVEMYRCVNYKQKSG